MNDSRHEELERWVSDEAPGAFDEEILADPALAEEAFQALDLQQSLAEAAKPARRPVTRPAVWMGGLLAAVLALFIILPRLQDPGNEGPPRLRGQGQGPAPVALTPAGELDSFPRTFRWSQASGNPDARFRWELYDAEARRRAVAVVADTVLVRPAAETPTDSLGTWRWLVVELLPDGREGGGSRAREFWLKEE